MFIASWLKSLTVRTSLRSSRRSRARRRPHGHVPALQRIEVLEDAVCSQPAPSIPLSALAGT